MMLGTYLNKLSSFQLKIIAIVCMLCDHIGYEFYDYSFFRIIGRITFPIFAYLISEGYSKTRNKKAYAERLLLFAVISQIPYGYAFGFDVLNIFFTLFLGLVALYIKDIFSVYVGAVLILLLALFAQLINTDCSWFGVLAIVVLSYLNVSWKKSILTFFILSTAYAIQSDFYLLLFWLVSFIFILNYNGEVGRFRLKWFFYLFYPVHLAIIALLASNHYTNNFILHNPLVIVSLILIFTIWIGIMFGMIFDNNIDSLLTSFVFIGLCFCLDFNYIIAYNIYYLIPILLLLNGITVIITRKLIFNC